MIAAGGGTARRGVVIVCGQELRTLEGVEGEMGIFLVLFSVLILGLGAMVAR